MHIYGDMAPLYRILKANAPRLVLGDEAVTVDTNH